MTGIAVGSVWRIRHKTKGEFSARVVELRPVAQGVGSATLEVTEGMARSRSEGNVGPGGRLDVRLSLTTFLYPV